MRNSCVARPEPQTLDKRLTIPVQLSNIPPWSHNSCPQPQFKMGSGKPKSPRPIRAHVVAAGALRFAILALRRSLITLAARVQGFSRVMYSAIAF